MSEWPTREPGEKYVYEFITRDASGRLHYYTQYCESDEDGIVVSTDEPTDLTPSREQSELERMLEWEVGLDDADLDPDGCVVEDGESLAGHRLHAWSDYWREPPVFWSR